MIYMIQKLLVRIHISQLMFKVFKKINWLLSSSKNKDSSYMKKKDCIALGYFLYAKYLKIWTTCLNIKKKFKIQINSLFNDKSSVTGVNMLGGILNISRYSILITFFFWYLSIIYRIIVYIITSYHIYKIYTYMMM